MHLQQLLSAYKVSSIYAATFSACAKKSCISCRKALDIYRNSSEMFSLPLNVVIFLVEHVVYETNCQLTRISKQSGIAFPTSRLRTYYL